MIRWLSVTNGWIFHILQCVKRRGREKESFIQFYYSFRIVNFIGMVKQKYMCVMSPLTKYLHEYMWYIYFFLSLDSFNITKPIIRVVKFHITAACIKDVLKLYCSDNPVAQYEDTTFFLSLSLFYTSKSTFQKHGILSCLTHNTLLFLRATHKIYHISGTYKCQLVKSFYVIKILRWHIEIFYLKIFLAFKAT